MQNFLSQTMAWFQFFLLPTSASEGSEPELKVFQLLDCERRNILTMLDMSGAAAGGFESTEQLET